MRCSGPRGPRVVDLRRPPPPNPRGPGASEPPAGLGAAKLERATCAAPVRCPNPPEARKARSSGAPQPLPFALPRPPLCPHAKPSTFLREQTSHRQAHRQTHRHSHAPTPRETAGLRKLLSQSQSAWERRGQDERAGGWLSGDTEAEIHEDSETDSKTARGDTDTHTHTHTHPRSEPNKTKKNCFLTFHMSGWCQTLLLDSQKSLLFLCKREVLSRRECFRTLIYLEMTQLFSTLSSLSLAQDRNSGNQNTWRNDCMFSKVLVTQSCLTLFDPMDCSPPGSSVLEIFQARILK